MFGNETKDNLFMGFVLMILGIGMIVGARGFQGALILEVGPDFFPTIIGSLIAGLSVILIITNALKLWAAAPADTASDNSGKPIVSAAAIRVLVALAFLIGYVVLIVPVGFLISSSIYMLIMMCFLAEKLSRRKIIFYAIISIVVAVLANFIFVRFFWLMLPRGILGF